MTQPIAISASNSSRVGERREGDADLERAGHRDVATSAGGDAERGQLVDAGGGDAVGELGVEARLDDADAEIAAVEARRLAALSVAHASAAVGGGDDGGSSRRRSR